MGTRNNYSIIQSNWDVTLKGKEAFFCKAFIVTGSTIYELQRLLVLKFVNLTVETMSNLIEMNSVYGTNPCGVNY